MASPWTTSTRYYYPHPPPFLSPPLSPGARRVSNSTHRPPPAAGRVADHLHARLHQVPPPEQAGDRGRAQQVRPHAPAPLHRRRQRGRAPAGRRQAVGRVALHGGGQGRHGGPRLVRVPRRLPPLRPRRCRRRRGDALRHPHADRRHPPRLRRHGARLPAEHNQRLLASATRCGEAGAVQKGPGQGSHEGEEEARRAAAHAPVRRGHGGHRLTEPRLLPSAGQHRHGRGLLRNHYLVALVLVLGVCLDVALSVKRPAFCFDADL